MLLLVITFFLLKLEVGEKFYNIDKLQRILSGGVKIGSGFYLHLSPLPSQAYIHVVQIYEDKFSTKCYLAERRNNSSGVALQSGRKVSSHTTTFDNFGIVCWRKFSFSLPFCFFQTKARTVSSIRKRKMYYRRGQLVHHRPIPGKALRHYNWWVANGGQRCYEIKHHNHQRHHRPAQ